ncbi:MAG: DUF3369 domain-containing protein [Fibrobacterales bacterium]
MSDLLIFAEEEEAQQSELGPPWRILLVDDDKEVHDVTRFVLKSKKLFNRPIEIISVYSFLEAKDLLMHDDDFALAYIDVVMETDDAGLQLIEFIRNDLKNSMMRLTIRTGQPGVAPEEDVITRFDINDYREKTDMNARRLFSSTYTALRSYREIIALNENRKGLKKVIESSGTIHGIQRLGEFGSGVLDQLANILFSDNGHGVNCGGVAVFKSDKGFDVIARTGEYGNTGESIVELGKSVVERITTVYQSRTTMIGDDYYAGYFTGHGGTEYVLYMHGQTIGISFDDELLELFCNNVSVARENNELKTHMDVTQKEIVYLLGEAVERRSEETGNHVRRVAHYSRLLATLRGLSSEQCEEIYMASPLHDLGKIAIPDAVLNKPGKLDAEEWLVMQKHAEYGHEMLRDSNNITLKAAAVIAYHHHEKWNGKGYPQQLSGEEIHMYGRITALADVFDALGSDRCYKDAWPLDAVLKLIRNEKGEHFDPDLVDLFLDNIDDFIDIRDRYSDV